MNHDYLTNTQSALKASMDYHLRCSLCKEPPSKECRDFFLATAFSLRDRMTEKILETESRYKEFKAKRIYYLSMEFLIGRLLGNTLYNLGLFDVCRNILEDKVMHIIYEYLQIVRGEKTPAVARTHIFAGKAAPGYWVAKQIIKLIHNVGQVINGDKRVQDVLKVVFLPDYRVSLAEKIIPAAELSEQISTAGTEASGTGNMKFMLNGALTVGTLDGANVEMLEEAGEGNLFIFGLTADEIAAMQRDHAYRPTEYYHAHPEIRLVIDSFGDDLFCPSEPGLFHWIYHRIMNEEDTYFHLPDLLSYIGIQEKIEEEYRNPPLWTQKAIFNVARSGKFSSDRAISDYAELIWKAGAVRGGEKE